MPKKYLRRTIYVLLAVSFALSYYQAQHTNISITEDFSTIIPNKNTAIFAAYSTDGRIPDYVTKYLKALKEISPNIIYVTDNPIKRGEIKKLTPYITHLIAKRHGEYDWGSYKRGFDWLKKNNHLKDINHLIFANDSTILVTDTLKPIISSISKNTDFFGITANQDGTYHLQSYFLIFKKQVYLHPQFAEYLNSVKPEPDGLTVAYRYEVPFTQFLHNLGFKSQAYIPYESLSHLPLNDKNCYPLTLLSKYHMPMLKMRTFTNRLTVKEPRRLVFHWLKINSPDAYRSLIKHLKHIDSPYLKENR